jgi:hypothetical protein
LFHHPLATIIVMVTDHPFRGDHVIVDRIRRTLYYGKVKQDDEVADCPSLPLTECAVDMFERLLKSGKSSADPISSGLSELDLSYASAVSEKACISPCSIVLAIIYMERLRKKNPEYLKSSSPCDLFLVSLLVASKYLFDDGEDEEVVNCEWAASGSLELKQLNKLELEFLTELEWDLHVDPAHFMAKLTTIEHIVAWKQTQLRGASFTYTEILSLESCLQWKELAPNVCTIMAFTLITYGVVLVAVMSASVVAAFILKPPAAASTNSTSPVTLSVSDGQQLLINHTRPCRTFRTAVLPPHRPVPVCRSLSQTLWPNFSKCNVQDV